MNFLTYAQWQLGPVYIVFIEPAENQVSGKPMQMIRAVQAKRPLKNIVYIRLIH